MLIGGDDISNDVVTLGTCFSRFVYIRSLIGGTLRAQLTGSHRGIGSGIQIPDTQLRVILPFPAPPPEHPGGVAGRLVQLIYPSGSIRSVQSALLLGLGVHIPGASCACSTKILLNSCKVFREYSNPIGQVKEKLCQLVGETCVSRRQSPHVVFAEFACYLQS